MLFHLELITRENIGLVDTPTAQKIGMEQIKVLMKSGKVKELYNYADEKGGFLIIDVDTSEELFSLIAPMMDVCSITSHPIVSIDTLQKLFQKMAK